MSSTIIAPGRVVKAPRLNTTDAGSVLNLRVAVDRYDAKARAKTSDFFEVSFWGKQAVRLADMIQVGSFVIVAGEFGVRSYDYNGVARQELQIRADRIDLGPRSATADDDRRPAPAGASQTPASDMDDEIPF
jgi:single-strand DNA-binding protein